MTIAPTPSLRPPWPEARPDPVLWGGALLFAALAVPTLGALALDARTHLGAPIWIKPLKFQASIAVYLGTLAWLSALMPAHVRAARWWRAYAVAVVGAFVYEIVWIGGAAALGGASHFNVGTPLWSGLYAAAGILAVFGTSAAAVAAWHVGGATPGRRAVSLGLWITFALTIVTAGTLSGMAGHEVGGDGLDLGGGPFGWSRDGGDLRAPHFLATHAMQVVPAAALALAWLLPAGRAVVWAVAALYAALTLAVFAEALAGRPFLSTILRAAGPWA